jgi:type IV secretory pathway TrbD component
MAQLRTTAMQRALNRPNLFLGGERELVLTSGLLCFGLAISSVNLPTTLVGLILWFIIIALLRMMAKADPMMSRVYLRQLRYRLHYAPRSRPHRQE